MLTDTDEDRTHRRHLGAAIRLRRIDLQLTLEQLAHLAGIEPATLAALEAGAYLNAFELRQRHALQGVLGWASGSYERVLIDMGRPHLLARPAHLG